MAGQFGRARQEPRFLAALLVYPAGCNTKDQGSTWQEVEIRQQHSKYPEHARLHFPPNDWPLHSRGCKRNKFVLFCQERVLAFLLCLQSTLSFSPSGS